MKRSYSHSLKVRAPVPVIWSVLSDIASWPHWTPTITRVTSLSRGATGVGSRFRVEQPGLPAATWTVTEWGADSGFTWVSTAPGIEVTARHLLEDLGESSRVVLSLGYAGLLGGWLARWTDRYNTSYPELEGEGLRRRSEALAAGLLPPPLSALEIPWTAPPVLRFRRASLSSAA